MVIHAFTHCGSRGRWISKFKAILVYTVSSRTARATQGNSVPKNKNKKPKKKEKRKEREKEKKK